MSKSVIIPIFNKEYKTVVCWGGLPHLRKTLLNHHYSPDNISKTFIKDQTENRRGVTFREFRCYPVIWINADLPFHDCMGTLSHEAVHAVDFIFQAIDEDVVHSEVFAHSVGAVVRETLIAMKILKGSL